MQTKNTDKQFYKLNIGLALIIIGIFLSIAVAVYYYNYKQAERVVVQQVVIEKPSASNCPNLACYTWGEYEYFFSQSSNQSYDLFDLHLKFKDHKQLAVLYQAKNPIAKVFCYEGVDFRVGDGVIIVTPSTYHCKHYSESNWGLEKATQMANDPNLITQVNTAITETEAKLTKMFCSSITPQHQIQLTHPQKPRTNEQ